MKTERLEKWKQVRSKGFARYVLAKGVLMCGLPLFLVMYFLMQHHGIDVEFAGLSLLLSSLGGAVVGIAMWVVQERLFRNAVNTSG